MKFLYQDSSRISASELEKTTDSVRDYIEHIKQVVAAANYDAAESSINLPSDAALLENVQKLVAEKVTPELTYILDIGIGGSNLGTKALYDALHGAFDIIEPTRTPKMIFLDTTNPEFLEKTVAFLLGTIKTEHEILINVISKSGGTSETIINTEIVLAALRNTFPEINKRVVITTDEGSALWQEAEKQGISHLAIPKQVGGRYSVLSAVGLFPLAACGMDITKLREGAVQARTSALEKTTSDAALSASILYLLNKQGKNINDNFFFAPQLESLGKWYRQLMGESIGKDVDLDGTQAHTGITPTVSLGSTDLHSVAQLYLGGPKDKITTFISVEGQPQNVRLPETLQFPLVDHIAGKSPANVMDAIAQGVKIAYGKQELPYTEIVLTGVNEFEIGQFMQFKMIEMMILGKLLNVNTFDQPHVELYKVETKEILKKNA